MFRFLFCLGSLIDWQICESVKPCQTIGVLAAAKPQFGAPGGRCAQQDCGLDDRYCISPQSRRDPPVHVGRSLRGDARRHPDGESLRSSDSSYSEDAANTGTKAVKSAP